MAKTTVRIGKVTMTTHGKYDASKSYPQLGVVTDGDGLKCYVSLVPDNKGNNLDDTSKWRLMIDATSAVTKAESRADENTKKRVVIKTVSDSSETLLPWKMYEFPEMPSLNISLSPPVEGELNEWQFSFDSGSAATRLALPQGVVLASAVSVLPNMHYEVTILYNEREKKYYGIMVGWSR